MLAAAQPSGHPSSLFFGQIGRVTLRGLATGAGWRRAAWVLVLTLIASTLSIALDRQPAAAASSPDCRRISYLAHDVPLVVGGEAEIVGTLCAQPGDGVVQILVSGATYSEEYWDFPEQPERYSYVRAMREAGIATFTFDRLGIGASTHPSSAEVTLPGQVEVVHQLIAALRSGQFGQQFAKVVLVGHSLGSVISQAVAGQYPADADGLIVTGMARALDPVGTLQLFLTLAHPARTEGGRFADLDLGYLTTKPGQRSVFYHQPTADAAVISTDEATKETITAGEIATGQLSLISTLTLRVPVLTVMGDRDGLFCTLVACSSPLSPWNAERLSYPLVPSFTQLTVPNTGHNINLHPNGDIFFDKAASWTQQVAG